LQPERDLSRSPLFQVIFNMLSFGFDAEVPAADLRMRPVPSLDVLTVTDGLTLYGFDTRDQLDLSFVYSPELFDADTIGRMAGHFHNLLRAIVADPGQRVSTLPLLTEAERDRLLVHWNATDRSFPTDRCYVEHVESHAAVTPNAVAVVDDGGQLTYGELNAWANGVARSLIAAGVGPNRPVAVYCERSRLLLVWVLAIFKAGGAYLPLDPRHPPGRVTEILGCSGPTAVLVADHLAARLAEALSALPGDERPAVLPERDHGIQDGDDSNPPSRATPENLAYIIFTSGSTGVPKGAMVPQRAMLNHFWSKIHGFGLTSADSVVQSAPQGFDISVWQLLAILLVGGRVRIASDSVTHEPERLFQLVLEEEPTLLEVVPSFLRAYLDSIGPEPGAGAFGRLRWLVLGGEALTPDLCRRWLTRWPGTPMVNGYGPSECADDAARYLIDTPPADDVSSVPIGRPIDNVHLYVLDRNLALVPQGVPGELCIGGKSVGLGYLNDPERTAAAFTDDPYGTTPGARLYRTGDRARIRSDGVIEFLGRVDHQVKIRGHRIELGEIEALLARHARVGQAIVSVWRTPTGDRLAAYIVADDPSSPPADDDLRDHLRRALPAYMVPDAFVLLERMPLNANGKVNRKALPSPTVKIADDFVPPLTSTEIAVARIWSEILDAKRVGVHDNFFELGGHSLLAARVAARMRRDLDVDLPVRALFEMQTVGELGAHLEALLEARASREELSL
jgi:amino acid adenylation domain-containing protein